MEIMNDLDLAYSTYSSNPLAGFYYIFDIFLKMIIIMVILYLLFLLCFARVYKKLGIKGWYVIIPILNAWSLAESLGIKGWHTIIPVYNIFIILKLFYLTPIALGYDRAFGILNIFIPYITIPVMAFSKKSRVLFNNDQAPAYTQQTPVMTEVTQAPAAPVAPVMPAAPVMPEVAPMINQVPVALVAPVASEMGQVPVDNNMQSSSSNPTQNYM